MGGNMKKIFVWVFMLFFFFNVHAQKIRIKWEKTSTPSATSCYILGGNSINDFWMYNEFGVLYHYINSNWKSFEPEISFKSVFYYYKYVNNNKFFMIAWDKNWHSHFFLFEDENWYKDPLIVEVPDRPGPLEGRPSLREMVNQAIGINL